MEKRMFIVVMLLVTATGTVQAATLDAQSCSVTHVSQAIASASDGDTVIIPEGTCVWDSGILLEKQLHIKGRTKGGVKLVMGAGINSWDTAMLDIRTGTDFSAEISQLEFWPGQGIGSYIALDGSVSDRPPLIHDNLFSSSGSGQLFNFIRYGRYGGGVIYGNVFQSTYNGNTQYFGSGGIQVKDGNGAASWSRASTMGIADENGLSNIYIEDNKFTNVPAFDSDDGSRIVFRNNILNNSGMMSHGADTSWIGLRHIEIYDNVLVFNPSGTWSLKDMEGRTVTGQYPLNINSWYDTRGGTGVITGNLMPDIISQMWGDKPELAMQIQQSDRNAGPDACCSTYPCFHQVGRGKDNGAEPFHIWGNTGTGKPESPSIQNSGYGECPANPNRNNPSYYIQPGRDYVIGAKPGWQRYPYPHPLRSAKRIIPEDRSVDWSRANIGVPGGITHRTLNCTTSACNSVWSGTVTASSLKSAIDSAPADSVVRIPSGTFTLNGEVVVSRDNVTVRGQGMNRTVLRIGDFPAFHTEEYGATASGSITSGYTKGSTSIIVSDASGVSAGDLIFIYQRDDPALVWTRSGANENALRFGARVTGVSGKTITFSPAIPYTLQSQFSPAFKSHSRVKDFLGFEDMTIDGGSNEPWRSIYLVETFGSWVKGVEVRNFGDTAIGALQSVRGEVRECYVHDTNTVNDGYGVYLMSDYGGVGTNSGFLIEDNIFASLWLGVMFKGASYNAVAYNLIKDTSIPMGWHQTPGINTNHGAHGIMNLIEGNVAQQLQNDGYHGSTSHTTIFRNRFHGLCGDEAPYCEYPGGNRKMIDLCRFSWYENIVGNVLGDASWNPAEYEMTGNDRDYSHSVIYRLGYPNMGNNYYNPARPPGDGDDGGFDSKVKDTMLRHGNYDYYNRQVVWDPHIEARSIPASLIYASKPAWFGSVPWPPIGPDAIGYQNKIPAELRFEGLTVCRPMVIEDVLLLLSQWKHGQITMAQMMQGIAEWKRGC